MKAFEYGEFYKEWEELSSSISERFDIPFLSSWLTPVDEDNFMSIMMECKILHYDAIHLIESKTDFRFSSVDFLNIFKQYSFNRIAEMEYGFNPGNVYPKHISLMMVAIAYANHADRRSDGDVHNIYPSIAGTANELLNMLHHMNMDQSLDINLQNKGLILKYYQDNNDWTIQYPDQ